MARLGGEGETVERQGVWPGSTGARVARIARRNLGRVYGHLSNEHAQSAGGAVELWPGDCDGATDGNGLTESSRGTVRNGQKRFVKIVLASVSGFGIVLA